MSPLQASGKPQRLLAAGVLVVEAHQTVFEGMDLYLGDFFYDLFETIGPAVHAIDFIADNVLLSFALDLINLVIYSRPHRHDVGQRNLDALAAVMSVGHDHQLEEWVDRYARKQPEHVYNQLKRVL